MGLMSLRLANRPLTEGRPVAGTTARAEHYELQYSQTGLARRAGTGDRPGLRALLSIATSDGPGIRTAKV
jgi:hypothetical protein